MSWADTSTDTSSSHADATRPAGNGNYSPEQVLPHGAYSMEPQAAVRSEQGQTQAKGDSRPKGKGKGDCKPKGAKGDTKGMQKGNCKGKGKHKEKQPTGKGG